MNRYLVVANQTLGGATLTELVVLRATLESASVHVLVPATDPADEHPPATGAPSENALSRLNEALERLAAAGVAATGQVGAADPMEAIRGALADNRYAGIILSTLPAGISRWLHMDLPHRIVREFNLAVEWVETASDDTDQATVSHIAVPAEVTEYLHSREFG